MKIDPKELENFLNEANKSTYANKDAPKAFPTRLKSEDYHFEEGNLVYHDTYLGSKDFIGEEVVYKDGEPVWAMNYYGFILKPDASTEEVYDFLRQALMEDYDDILSVRGPKEYKKGQSIYRNAPEGTLDRFSGTEQIKLKGEKVYTCWYHGGSIE